MRDGLTRKMTADTIDDSSFLRRHLVSIVLVSGENAGAEYAIDKDTFTLGRGPAVDLAFDNEHLSRQHAALEATEHGFRVRDMGSTNGLKVDGETVNAHDLTHGDKFAIGNLVFQYVVQEKPSL